MEEGGERRKRQQEGLNVCKLNVPRLYLAREFKGVREKRQLAHPRNGILSNKATRSRIKERDCIRCPVFNSCFPRTATINPEKPSFSMLFVYEIRWFATPSSANRR